MTIKELFQQAPQIDSVLKDHAMYWAHLPARSDSGKDEETLHKHVELVNTYAEKIVEVNNLEPVINSLVEALVESLPEQLDRQLLESAIKRRFVYSIVFHDFGKVNVNFQIDRMKNHKHFSDRISVPFQPEHAHSELSAFIYNSFFLKEAPPTSPEGQMLAILTLYFSYPILNHHKKGLFDPGEEYSKKSSWNLRFPEFTAFEKLYNWQQQDDEPMLRKIMLNVQQAFLQFQRRNKDNFALFALLKLNFSILTASDYLATSHYMNGFPIDDFGIIDAALKTKILQNAHSSKPYNKEIWEDLYSTNFHFQNPTEPTNDNLNRLRKEMAVEVLQNITAHGNQRLFYIEAPTGGGKTNMSMLAAAKLLELNSELNKIFYVFPFTTLVTQTFQSLLETYNLDEDVVAQIHSKVGYKETSKEGEYGAEKRNFLQNLFHHYPISLLTHIRFFDWLKTNFKEANYAFHRLANSVVIIDELQSYNPKHWDKIIWLLDKYAFHFNIRFILMSATLPKLGDLLPATTGQDVQIVHLLPDAKPKYFQNPNFNRRVSFDFSLLDREMDLESLADEVLLHSEVYAQNQKLYENSVYTIVEFIFKRSASAFYEVLKNREFPLFDEVFVLSGTILEPRRREIINALKNPELRKKKVLLITTQVVEAGVDIDMDLGFKDTSLIDSDEQLAGRINRNVKKKNCKLYLFRIDKASILYKNDFRYQQVRDRKIKTADYQRILQEKDFDYLYRLVFNEINEWNKEDMLKNLKAYLGELKGLNFPAVHRNFQLIEQDNLSVFVPLNLPIEVPGQEEGKLERIFSEEEIKFLARNGIITSNEKISGEEVFDLYVRIVQNREGDYISRTTDFKKLQAILSRFVFSVFASSRLESELKKYARNESSSEQEDYDEYGYLYLLHYDKVYDYEQGLKESEFENFENSIL